MFWGQAQTFVETPVDAAIAIHTELEHMTCSIPRTVAIRELRHDLLNDADFFLDGGDFGRVEVIRLLLNALDDEDGSSTSTA